MPTKGCMVCLRYSSQLIKFIFLKKHKINITLKSQRFVLNNNEFWSRQVSCILELTWGLLKTVRPKLWKSNLFNSVHKKSYKLRHLHQSRWTQLFTAYTVLKERFWHGGQNEGNICGTTKETKERRRTTRDKEKEARTSQRGQV